MNIPLSGSTPAPASPGANKPQTIIIRQQGAFSSWFTRILIFLLILAILVAIGTVLQYQEYISGQQPKERFHSGDKNATEKIALVEVSGVIMSPFTGRILGALKRAEEDSDVKGVILVIDSPGGAVADSHQIYHRVQQLVKKKPVFVSMKRMAASGGYYIAMGAGKDAVIYAEETTWTGSIGVIIPRYNLTKLAENWDIKVEPIKTGPFKDSLSPFRDLSPEEHTLWNAILDDAFQRFLNVIADNRKSLDYDAVKALATGQIYPALEAHKKGMIDKIGYEEDVISDLKKHLGYDNIRVVGYNTQQTYLETLLGSAEANRPENRWKTLLNATVPQAMYLCSWAPGILGSY